PAYMAPEQFLGLPADARCDQFGFCVTLWETLHGVRPFKGDTPMELAVTMMGDIVPTTPVGSTVPAWLRRVIARGLAKEPADRFATMDDLLAALADDPARARRRWLAIGTIGAAAAAAVAWNGWQHARARDDCRAQAQSVSEVWNDGARETVRAAILAPGPAYGSSTWERLEPRIDAYAQRWSELRESTCIAALDGTRALDIAMRGDECLLERRDDLASAIDVLSATDGTTVHSAVPIVDALPQLDRCDDEGWLARRRGQSEEIEQRSLIAELRRELARSRSLRAGGDARAALAAAEPVLERAEAIGWTPLRVDALLAVGTNAQSTGDTGRAVELYERAFDLAVDDGDDEDANEALASLVGVNASALGRPDQAQVWARVAEAFLARSDPEGGLPTASVLVERGALNRVRGDYRAAEADFTRALEIRERVLGSANLQTLAVLNNLAASQFDRSDYDAAIATLERVVAGRTSILGPEHPEVARALMMLAAAKGAKGVYGEGLELLERALVIQERVHGPDSPNVALTLHNLGTMNDFAGDFAAATAAHRRELAIREAMVPPVPLATARALLGLGRTLDHGNSDEAMAYLERARAIFERVLGPNHTDLALCLEDIASAHDDRGEHDQALPLRRRVLAIREQAYGPDHADVGAALSDLGSTQLHLGDTDGALDSLRRGLL
ncbi:MAG TPA: tetratricopeptide repeat-containing protein kinase family protein, partial [Nannocystaceae bacterium]|nr:tetratricopeptide repeat-containing protein kinase family protein [Nannocystaceae bacterium]